MRKGNRIFMVSLLLCAALVWQAGAAGTDVRALSKETCGVDPNRPMVALTYDDGPYSPVTNRILDALEACGGRATFFVVGDRVAGCASVLRRADQLGCQIGIHSWDHTTELTSLNRSQIQSEAARCAAAIAEVIGREPTLLRPADGAEDARVREAVDYPIILWSVDTQDWLSKNSDSVYRRATSQVQDGDIILMHDLYPTTAEASEQIIPALTKMGFQLVTVEELAFWRGVSLEPHETYSKFELGEHAPLCA